MYRQLRSDLFIIRKSRITIAMIIFEVLFAFWSITNVFDYWDAKESSELSDSICLTILSDYRSIMAYLIAFISIMLIIRERSDGLIRNKLTTGIKKTDIFLSKVLSNYIISVVLYLIYILIVLVKCCLRLSSLPPFMTLTAMIGTFLMWLLFFSVLISVIDLCFTSEIISVIFSFAVIYILPMIPDILQKRISDARYKGTFRLSLMKTIKRFIPDEYLTFDMFEDHTVSRITGSLKDGIVPFIILTSTLLLVGIFTFNRKEFD